MSEFTGFQKVFKGDLVRPGGADYEQAVSRWAKNARRNAEIVAFVKSAEDVALALKYAKLNKLPIAIRGGGHSPPGASSIEGGLVIDLSRYFNTVKVDAEKKLAYVGGGSIWETVDKAAIEHGLATVAGTVNHTGVGGLLLGGGFGWLSGAHGHVIDNLVQATVVIADGSILRASETENPDLFWAIRGGGSNFGVCTEFVLRLHPQRRTVFAGVAMFNPEALEQIVSVAEKWWIDGPSADESILVGFTRADSNPALIVIFFYNGSEVDGRVKYKAFFDLNPLVDMTKMIPYEEMNGITNGKSVPGSSCAYMKAISQMNFPIPALRQAFDRVQRIDSPEHSIDVVLELFPLTKIHSVPNGATALFRRPGHNVLALTRWTNDTPENLKYGRDITHEMMNTILTGEQGYGNYDFESDISIGADSALKSRAEVLFGDNYPRLQQIKRKYDPEQIFNKWFAITPAAT